MSHDSPNSKEYLDVFDSMDLDSRAERRMAVWALNEYLKAKLTEIGRNRLGIMDIHRHSCDNQESKIRTELEKIGSIDKEGEINSLTVRVDGIRDDIAHNTIQNPSKDEVQRLRGLVESWEDWLSIQLDKYSRDMEAIPQLEELKEQAEFDTYYEAADVKEREEL